MDGQGAAGVTSGTAPILAGLLFVLGAAFVLLPLARVIPARLQRQWALDAEEALALARQDPASQPGQAFTWIEKSLFAVVSGLLGHAVIAVHGLGVEGLALALYFFGLLLLVAINVKHLLLPDGIVLPLLWLGLLYHADMGAAADHIHGAVGGYLVPFLVMTAIKASSGKELMGRGDMKAFAMAGAWFGTAGLPTMLAGWVVGFAAWALILRWLGKRGQGFVSTGPAHLVGSLAMAFGTW